MSGAKPLDGLATDELLELLPPSFRGGVVAGAPHAQLLALALQAVRSAAGPLRARLQAAREALAKDAAAARLAKSAAQRTSVPLSMLQNLPPNHSTRGDHRGSLAHYTRALQKAPSDDASALAVLFAARSAALLGAGEASAALADATEALTLAPLYSKAWVCYAAAHPQASDAISTMAHRLTLSQHGEALAEDEALEIVEELRAAAAGSAEVQTADPAVAEGLAQANGSGRCLVATRPVGAPGSTLLVDTPLAVAIRRGDPGVQRCHWCMDVAVAAIPCPGCADARYCTARCRAAAWADEHQAECGCPLTLLLPAETVLAQRLRRLCRRDDSAAATVHALEGHEQDLDLEVSIGHALQAATVALLDSGDSEVAQQQAEELASDVFSMLCRIGSNSHAITAVVSLADSDTAASSGVSVEQVKQDRLAVAVYPTGSLANHSCSPTARVEFAPGSRNLRLVSASPLRTKAEVTISYGPTAGRTPAAKRRQQLQHQYRFLCRCSACEDEADLEQDDVEPLAEDEDEAFTAALDLLDSERTKDAIMALESCCTRQMSLLAAHDASGDQRRAATAAQRAAELCDALARAHCINDPPDYSAAGDACAAALMLLRRSVAPGAEPSLAREDHKLATLRFHGAVQAGPGPRGQAAVALAAAAAQRALISVREALGESDPAIAELTQMAAALGGPQHQQPKQQREEPKAGPKAGPKTEPKTEAKASTAASQKARSQRKTQLDTSTTVEAAKQAIPATVSAKPSKSKSAAKPAPAVSPAEKIRRCVETLRTSEVVNERLALATQLYGLLGPESNVGDDERVILQQAFTEAGGPEVIFQRLSSMDDSWMQEAKNGATDLYDKLARVCKDDFVEVSRIEDEKLADALHAAKEDCECTDCGPDGKPKSFTGLPNKLPKNLKGATEEELDAASVLVARVAIKAAQNEANK